MQHMIRRGFSAVRPKIGQISHQYYQNTGRPLAVNQQNLIEMMRLIGANSQETPFVYDRMVANSQAATAIVQTDGVINKYQNFLNCLNTQGTGCIP